MRRTFLTSGDPQVEDKRWYVLQNWRQDPVAILDEARRPPRTQRERVFFSPYGRIFGLPATRLAGDTGFDGDYGSGDSTAISGWSTAYQAYADVDLDGDIDATDATFSTNVGMGWDVLSRDGSTITYAGYVCDDSIPTVNHVRHRVLKTDLGRWVQRDPAGYVDGASLYEYVRSSPVKHVDPTGLAAGAEPCTKHKPRIWDPHDTKFAPHIERNSRSVSTYSHVVMTSQGHQVQRYSDFTVEVVATQEHESVRIDTISTLRSFDRYSIFGIRTGTSRKRHEGQVSSQVNATLDCKTESDGSGTPRIRRQSGVDYVNLTVSTATLGKWQMAASSGWRNEELVYEVPYNGGLYTVLYITPDGSGAAADKTTTGGSAGIKIGGQLGKLTGEVHAAVHWETTGDSYQFNGITTDALAWYCVCTSTAPQGSR